MAVINSGLPSWRHFRRVEERVGLWVRGEEGGGKRSEEGCKEGERNGGRRSEERGWEARESYVVL